MSKHMYICKGLPGSGKSTWAKKLVAESRKDYTIRRVNRDDIRRMMGRYDDFSPSREEIVTAATEAIVVTAFERGESVVIDDCNLNPAYQKRWFEIAKAFEATVNVQDFTDVSLRECLKRNQQRTGEERVANKVIHDMYNKWLAPKKQKHDPEKPTAIICDLDGTLAHIGNRSPYDASECDVVDTLNIPVAEVITRQFAAGVAVILMSGREEKDRAATLRFLDKHGVPYHKLHMRSTRDRRPDYIIKRELFEAHVEGQYNVLFCIDDRDQVVDLWRSMGLTCFQVGEGWF